MQAHSNVLQHEAFREALAETGLASQGVYLEPITQHGSKSRARAFKISLSAEAGRDFNGKARRPKNSGRYGAESSYYKAATYDEWGVFIRALFRRDPEMKFGPYDGVQDFHEKTGHRFAQEALA